MKKIFIVLLALSICSVFLISCDEERIQALQEQVHIEKQSKMEFQKDAENSKNSLYLLVGISIAGVLIAMIIGVAMGSKSRKDLDTLDTDERRDNDER